MRPATAQMAAVSGARASRARKIVCFINPLEVINEALLATVKFSSGTT